MYKEITLQMANGDEKAIPFVANGGTAVRFRMIFKKELLGAITDILNATGSNGLAALIKLSKEREAAGVDEVGLEELDPETLQAIIAIAGSGELDSISKLAFIMNKAAEGADMKTLDVEGYLDWLEQFETMEFLTHAMDILELYMSNKTTTSTPKKEAAQLIEK